jgi:hypothetical protein
MCRYSWACLEIPGHVSKILTSDSRSARSVNRLISALCYLHVTVVSLFVRRACWNALLAPPWGTPQIRRQVGAQIWTLRLQAKGPMSLQTIGIAFG